MCPYVHTYKGEAGVRVREGGVTAAAEVRVIQWLYVKMKEGAMSQEMQVASRSWKR